MRITACVLLTLLAYGCLYTSGVCLIPLLVTRIVSFMTAAGLLLGVIGGGTLFAALRLAPKNTGLNRFNRRQLMLFGLLFPGAAQIYARRWTLGITFLLGPIAAYIAAFSIVLILRYAAPQYLPGSSRPLLLTIPVFFALLWLGSLYEAYIWSARLPADIDVSGWPRGRSVLTTMGAALFLLPIMILFLLRFMVVTMKAETDWKVGRAGRGGLTTSATDNDRVTPPSAAQK